MTNHPNRSQTYTVLNRDGFVEGEGLNLAEAARAVMCYDGHAYEIRPSGDGFDLWTSTVSRNSPAYCGLTRSTIWSANEDRALAEAEIYRKVVKSAAWWCGCRVMTDAEHAASVARLAGHDAD